MTTFFALNPKIRRQKKQLFLWYPSERSDLKLVDEETNVIDQLEVVKDQLKRKKHACLYVRLEHLRSFQVLE